MIPRDGKELRSGERILFAVAGGVLGLIATWVFAFGFYGVPSTSSGVEGVLGVAPIGVLSGCVAGITASYFLQKRSRKK